MAWEERNGRHYYYRKMRRGKKVISEYVGTGELASLFAELDKADRNQKVYVQTKWKKQKESLSQMDSDVVQAATLIRNIVRAYLLISGYHPHKGQFRRRRNEK